MSFLPSGAYAVESSAYSSYIVLDGFFLGLIASLIVAGLAMMWSARDRLYLHFALFLAANAGLVATVFGQPAIDTLGHRVFYAALVFLGLVALTGTLFTLNLLSIRQNNRPLFWPWTVLTTISLVTLALIGYLTAINAFEPSFANVLQASVIAWVAYEAIAIGTLTSFWRQSTAARFWFIAITIHMTVAVLCLLAVTMPSDLSTSARLSIELSTLVGALMLTAVLGYRYRYTQSSALDAQLRSIERLRLTQDLQRAKSNFIATVGHDLRSPMRAIRHFVESLRVDGTESTPDTLDKIDRSVDTISELLDGMIRLSQAEWRIRSPRPEAVALVPLLLVLKDEFEPVAAKQGLEFQVDVTGSFVLGDKISLSQILRNLVDNAFKYTQSGFVRVRVDESGDRVSIKVEDSGIGIPENDREHIFDEFYQAKAGDEESAGVGLGLSIVARLAEMQNIGISVTSRQDEGSCFELQMEKVDALDWESPDAARHSTKAQLDGLVICLVVGNQRGLRYRELLENWGADVWSFDSCRECREATNDLSGALYLLDLQSWQELQALQPQESSGIHENSVLLMLMEDETPEHVPEHISIFRDGASAMRFRSVIQRVLSR